MTKFLYKARDRYGVERRGSMEAPTTRDVTSILEEKRLVPVSVEIEEGSRENAAIEKFMERFERRVNNEDLLILCQQLSSLLSAGITIISSLVAVQEVIKSKRLKRAMIAVKEDIDKGSSFSEALANYPDIFPDFMVNMIRAGERAGIISEIMVKIASMLQKEIDTQRQIKAATRYPLMVLFALAVGFVVVITFVIPKFAVIYASFKVDLPLPTRILIGINYSISRFWLLAIIVCAALYYAFRKSIESPQGKMQFDRFTLSIPVFGPLMTKIILARFTRMFASMLAAGIIVVDALNISSKISGNDVFRKVIQDMRDAVIEGETLSDNMKSANIFPSVAVQMVATGEKTGNLSQLLGDVADYFERETGYMTANLTALIEPMLVFFLGMMVLMLALGVYLPIWSIMNLYKQ